MLETFWRNCRNVILTLVGLRAECRVASLLIRAQLLHERLCEVWTQLGVGHHWASTRQRYVRCDRVVKQRVDALNARVGEAYNVIKRQNCMSNCNFHTWSNAENLHN